MSERDDYPAGVPCWVTCLSPDVPAAMEFYGALFGWTFETNDAQDYAVGHLRGREAAGIGSVSAAGPDVRPAWITEVRVDRAEDVAERAAGAGGRVIAGPMDVSPAGRLTVLGDPSDAVICGFEAGARKGARVLNEPGAWAMSALSTRDAEGAATFYGTLFGWEREPFGPITMWRRPGYVGGEPEQPVPRDVVAVMEPGEGPARWTPDFWVDDADAAASTAEAAGGSVLSAPGDRGLFRSATLADPAGAAFTVSQLMEG
jgi:uncharacterized protein